MNWTRCGEMSRFTGGEGRRDQGETKGETPLGRVLSSLPPPFFPSRLKENSPVLNGVGTLPNFPAHPGRASLGAVGIDIALVEISGEGEDALGSYVSCMPHWPMEEGTKSDGNRLG
jgi:hypothetical protein